MKLLFLFGDSSVGKMTVGQELTKITPFRLFHNHLSIEPVLEVFGGFHHAAVARIRDVFFEEFARTDNYGLIFTFMWAFNQQADWDYVAHVRAIFEAVGAEIYYVELDAPQDVRLARNATPNRLAHKPSKRDVEASNARLLRESQRYRCESLPGEITFPNYLRIRNAEISAADAAEMIRLHFGF
ncbi:MAG: AAA family ATPase [Clostridia bacterium]|nr:AAA family ATPase [Clostridia bacterium]